MHKGAACLRRGVLLRVQRHLLLAAHSIPRPLHSMQSRASGDSSGKTYLVTGSTDGIGRHTAEKLLRAGGNVIVHGRNPERVKKAVQQLTECAQGASVTSYTYDLASLSEVRQFAEAVKADHQRIDTLINNAGVFETKKKLSADGFEMTWGVNVLAPFLLTALLKDHIKERIVNVSSISAGSRIDFDNLQQEKGFSSHNSYSLSKLAAMMFTFELADIMKPKGITVNCLDPGTVNTKMLIAGWGACGIDIKDANNEFKLATDPSLALTTGQYFVEGRQSRAPADAKDHKKRQQLWQIMEKQTGATY